MIRVHESRKRGSKSSLALCAAVAALLSQQAYAGNATWTGAAGDLLWASGTNWDTNSAPGANDGTFISSDVATFSAPAAATVLVTVDPNRNISGITFDTTTTSYTIGTVTGNALYLSAGGTTKVTVNGATATSPAISAPIVLMGDYTFDNQSSTGTSGLKANGSIGAGVASAVTLTLKGVNLASSTGSNCQVNGTISDGVGLGPVKVVKEGTGVWEIKGTANTYSGDTIVNGGLLRLNSSGAMSANSNYIANAGGTFRFNVTGITGKSLTVNTGGIAQGSADAVRTFFANNSGPGIYLNFTGATGAVNQTFQGGLSGTVAGQGGIKLSLSDTTGKVTLTKSYDLGSVDRPFDIAASAANAAVGDPDLQINGVISGAGGIIKQGPGTLKLNKALNTYTGQLEIQAGSVRFNGDNAIPANVLLIDGGDLNVESATQTFSSFSMTKGTISANSVTPGSVVAPAYNFNVAAADTGQVKAILPGAGFLTKSGGGKVTLAVNNTYSGGTTIAGGTLKISTNQGLGSGGLTINSGGTLELAAGLPKAFVLPSGTTNAGRINVNDNGLIVNYSGTSSPAGAIRAQLVAGYGPGDWSGTIGINSSVTNADTTHHHALAYGDAAALGITSFGGQTITGNAVVVKYTYAGDSNLDGVVDLDNDFSLFVGGYNKQITDPSSLNASNLWVNGDYNYDGVIDLDNDFSIFVDSYAAFTQNPAQLAQLDSIINSMDLTTAQKNALLSVVPEPGMLAFGVMGAVQILRCRSRRPKR